MSEPAVPLPSWVAPAPRRGIGCEGTPSATARDTFRATSSSVASSLFICEALERQSGPYRIGSSNEKTSALDTFVAREGVCRDFSHVMAAFARAAGIPARLVSAYAWKLEPQDFHAVVDVWLDGRWRLVDASGLAPIEGLVRIAVGRDATDVSFMTIFGFAELRDQQVRVTRVDEQRHEHAYHQGASLPS